MDLVWIWMMRNRYMMAPPRLPCAKSVREALAGTPSKGGVASAPSFKTCFDLRHPFAELRGRGMDNGKDCRHMLQPEAPPGGEHERFAPAERFAQPGSRQDDVCFRGRLGGGAVPLLVESDGSGRMRPGLTAL